MWGLFSRAFIFNILYLFIAVALNGRIKNVNHEIMENNAEMQSYFKEFIQGMDIIKSNDIKLEAQNKLLNKYKRYIDSIFKGNIITVVSSSSAEIVDKIGNLVVIILGFYFVEANIITLGEMFSFYLMLACMTEPIKDILSLQYTFQSGKVALERLEDISFMENENNDGEELVGNTICLEVKNASFRYFGKSLLYNNLAFQLSGNDKLFLCGSNGSGKSTILKQIVGMEETPEGCIKVNGIDLNRVNLSSLRNIISYVGQNNFLFADTIRNNITLGSKQYSEEKLNKACINSGLSDLINDLPMGYDTFINEGGANLSLGQRQAIAIARAIIRKPGMLLLDEATSNMDAEKEKLVMSNIAQMQIPCIIVSHNIELRDLFDSKKIINVCVE